jgi:hypothetical protein
MENGEYYMEIEMNGDPNYPRLILGYVLNGQRVEIYKSQETYTVFNTKTEKYLTCLGFEHARFVFKECVRMLAHSAEA